MGSSVGWINNLLSPGYKIELPLDESFSLSDDDLEMAKDFNVKELGVGDTITPEMWDSRKNRIIVYVFICKKEYSFNTIGKLLDLMNLETLNLE